MIKSAFIVALVAILIAIVAHLDRDDCLSFLLLQQQHRRQRIAIVGAGLTGLTAAVELRHSGLPIDIAVIEASPRLGGRVLRWGDADNVTAARRMTSTRKDDEEKQRDTRTTVDNNNNDRVEFLDTGATFIHGVDGGNPVKALCNRYGLQTVPISYDSVRIYHSGGSSSNKDEGNGGNELDEDFIDEVKTLLYDPARQLMYVLRNEMMTTNRGSNPRDNLLEVFVAAIEILAKNESSKYPRRGRSFEAGKDVVSSSNNSNKTIQLAKTTLEVVEWWRSCSVSDNCTEQSWNEHFAATSAAAESTTQKRTVARAVSWHFFWEIVQDQIAELHELSAIEYDASSAFPGDDHILPQGVGSIVHALAADFVGLDEELRELKKLRNQHNHQQQQRRILDVIAAKLSRHARVSARATTAVAEDESAANHRRFLFLNAPVKRISLLDAHHSPPKRRRNNVAVDRSTFSSLYRDAILSGMDDAATTSDVALDEDGAAPDLAGTGVEIELGGSKQQQQRVLEADAVIVTVPLGVLKHSVDKEEEDVDAKEVHEPEAATCSGSNTMDKSNDSSSNDNNLNFEPPLPRWFHRAAAALGCGSTLKVALRYPTVFWPADTHFFGLVGDGFDLMQNRSGGSSSSSSNKNTNNDQPPERMLFGSADHIEVTNLHAVLKNRVLVLEVEADFAVQLSNRLPPTMSIRVDEDLKKRVSQYRDHDHNDIEAAALSTLQQTLLSRLASAFAQGENAALYPTDIVIHNYVKNPLIGRCGFSFWPPGRSGDDNLLLAEPQWRGRLRFAGEHTTALFYANMHGAVMEGIRSARAVLREQVVPRLIAESWVLSGLVRVFDAVDCVRSWLSSAKSMFTTSLSVSKNKKPTARGSARQMDKHKKKQQQQRTAAKKRKRSKHFRPNWCPAPCR